jgi:hypothetical protein
MVDRSPIQGRRRHHSRCLTDRTPGVLDASRRPSRGPSRTSMNPSRRPLPDVRAARHRHCGNGGPNPPSVPHRRRCAPAPAGTASTHDPTRRAEPAYPNEGQQRQRRRVTTDTPKGAIHRPRKTSPRPATTPTRSHALQQRRTQYCGLGCAALQRTGRTSLTATNGLVAIQDLIHVQRFLGFPHLAQCGAVGSACSANSCLLFETE